VTILGDRVLVDNVGQWNVRGRHPSWFDCNKEMSHNVTIVFQPGVVVQGIDGTFVRFFLFQFNFQQSDFIALLLIEQSVGHVDAFRKLQQLEDFWLWSDSSHGQRQVLHRRRICSQVSEAAALSNPV
jgi:hypothetical protein